MSGVLWRLDPVRYPAGPAGRVPRLARVVIGRPGPSGWAGFTTNCPRLRRGSAETRGMQTPINYTIRALLQVVPHPVSKSPCGEQSPVRKDNISPKPS
jgi:hypothetical protein